MMLKKHYLWIAIVLIVIVGAIALWYSAKRNLNTEPTSTDIDSVIAATSSAPLEYRNDQYGFTFSLPNDWHGYSIVELEWTGYASGPSGQLPSKTGPEILIRNPHWTEQEKWQDIPILIYTHEEWGAVASGSLIVSAAPIPPQELGENAQYVFALPARYDYAFPEGWQEVETIMQNNPLHAF